jgi:hypothetical protein
VKNPKTFENSSEILVPKLLEIISTNFKKFLRISKIPENSLNLETSIPKLLKVPKIR